jgi:SAM-dependent methyltransferase
MDTSRVIGLAAASATDRSDLWSTVINTLQLATAVEVGVFEGGFASHILAHCPTVSSYYMLDPWRHLDNWNKPANMADREFAGIRERALAVTQFAEGRRIVLEGTTAEVAHQLPDQGLDFAYVDADHTLRGITIDLIRLWPKLRPGAILAGDDFCTSVWQHHPQFEPTFVFPWAVHFAEAMGCEILGLPFNQFAIIVNSGSPSGFAFHDLTQSYRSTAVRDALERRETETSQFSALYGDFRLNEDCRNLEISGLAKESGRIRGEIVKTIREIPATVSRILLPGENNAVKHAYVDLFQVPESQIVTAGLADNVDHRWNFEDAPPAFGTFDCIVSQAMLEHLLQPYKHVRDLVDALNTGGYLILHTVMPGFAYHRHPVDCVRFFPDWFEEVSQRLRLQVCDKYIGDLRIMYKFKKRQ